jgi:hypothetical protein
MLHSPHSTSFHPERGIGQGDTPSTLLFVAVFDILLTLLDAANTGTPHAYADDLAHIAPTLTAQQFQADLVSAFCLLTGLEIASAKVEAITLNGQHLHDNETMVVHDWHWEPHLVIQSNDSFWTRYLGIFLDRKACDKHYQMAQEKFKQACKFLLLRHAPPPVKHMVYTLCILPCIRYPAGLAPWTLQQYRDLDKIPYQLFKQIYGLRLTFPLSLIYTPIALGGCGAKSISDSIQLTKWKYLHSSIHLGGLAQATADALITRGSTTPRQQTTHTCYTDSLLQWAAQIGLTLHPHTSTPSPPLIQLLRNKLARPSPSPIIIYGDGSFALRPTTCLQHLTSTPNDLRNAQGTGATGLTATHVTHTGERTNLQIRITAQQEPCVTTPLFHELLSISFASAILPPSTPSTIYSDSRQALKLALMSYTKLTPAFSHLPCGPILKTIRSSTARLKLHWIRSHPENQSTANHWTPPQRGIHRVDLLAKLSDKARNALFPHDHVYTIDLPTLLNHIIPTGTWLWKHQGHYTFQSLGSYATHYHHRQYLEHRDSHRRLTSSMSQRWTTYNFALAAYITSASRPRTPRARGRICKHLYDWTGHMHNLAKGIPDPTTRTMATKCPLCSGLDNQIHSFTTCTHPTLTHLRQTYRPTIDALLRTISQDRYPPTQRWIPPLFHYINQRIWHSDEIAADIWSGRWSPAMFRSAIGHLSDLHITKSDAQMGRNSLRALTTLLLDLRQLLFKARTRLLSEGTHTRPWRQTRQLQLPRMIHPEPRARHLKRSRPTSFQATATSSTPWLKKTKRLPTPDRPTALSRQSTQHSRPHIRQLTTTTPISIIPPAVQSHTPQPPLLTTPHWTALRKRSCHIPLTPSPGPTPTHIQPRKLQRLSAAPNSPSTTRASSTFSTSTPTASITAPTPPRPRAKRSNSCTSRTRQKRPRLQPLTLPRLLSLPRRTQSTTHHPPLAPTPFPSQERQCQHPLPLASPPRKRPRLNIADQPPLLTSTFWGNLQRRHRPPSTLDGGRPLD